MLNSDEDFPYSSCKAQQLKMITFKVRKLEYQDTVIEHTTLDIEHHLKSRLHSFIGIIGINGIICIIGIIGIIGINGINESYFYSMKLPTQLYSSSLPSTKRDFSKFQM